jgi:hypothetical protein
VGFGSIDLSQSDAVGTSRLALANIVQLTGQAVLGVSTAGAGSMAPIGAGTNDRVLRQTGDALNFGQLTAGMFPALVVPDAALSANVPLLNTPNAFSGPILVTSVSPQVRWNETDAAADNVTWIALMGASAWSLAAYEDDLVTSSSAIRAFRSGSTITEVELNATALDFNGDADISGALQVNGSTTRLVNVFPRFQMSESDQGTDEKIWEILVSASNLDFRTRDDGFSGGNVGISLQRTGTVVDEIELNATTIDLNGKVETQASVSGAAGLSIPHGTAPSSPADGDIWTTTAGVFARINGATVQLATV